MKLTGKVQNVSHSEQGTQVQFEIVGKDGDTGRAGMTGQRVILTDPALDFNEFPVKSVVEIEFKSLLQP